jgi:hypothetical protein
MIGQLFALALWCVKWLVFIFLLCPPIIMLQGFLYLGCVFVRMTNNQAELTTNSQLMNFLSLLGLGGAILAFGWFMGG